MTAVRVPGCRGAIDLTDIDLALVGRFDDVGIEWAYTCPVCAREHHETTTATMLLRLVNVGVRCRWAWDHWALVFDVADDIARQTMARKH